jgi:diguanylate cyclase (GGDEF)-like protein/PAS domain S-box-containing protein
MMQVLLRWLPLLACLVASPAFALEKVTLQLKWTHAFQFAGYYAAQQQGYYRDAGLEVNIVEAAPDTDPVREVLEGKAQFGVGTSSLLLERAAGKPVVALAVIFQQSPYVIYARTDIRSLNDLKSRRMMLEPQSDELLAYLKKENIPLGSIEQIAHSLDPQDMIHGRIDAISGYISNQPYYFAQARFPYQTFSPRSAGIDFYGDNLFTAEAELKARPERVKAFRAASLRGWQYAKDHRDEVIGLIASQYSKQHTRDYLRFESDQMIPLLQPNLIEIGYMNPNRWRHIADTYADIGLLPRNFSLQGFLYDASKQDLTWFYRALLVALLLTFLVGAVALYILRINRKLHHSLAELNAAQQALAKSEKHYRLLVENMRDVVWLLDPNTLRFRYVSPSIERLRGYSAEEVMREPLDAALTPEYAAAMKQQIQHSMAEFLSGHDPDKVYVEEIRQPRKDGSSVWTEAIARFYRNEETGQVEVHGVTRDVSERKAAQEEIHYMAMHDLLTGLPNRMLLNDRLQQALVAARRDEGRVALMFLDLDKFKQINDTLGHDVGDQLLQQAAARMQECVRESDTVARIGGDEFIVLLRAVVDAHDAMVVAEKIRAALNRPFELMPHKLAI